MQTSGKAYQSAPVFPRWLRWTSLVGVFLLIIGFATFLQTLGQGGGELQLFTMALGAVIILLTVAWIVIALVLRLLKTRV